MLRDEGYEIDKNAEFRVLEDTKNLVVNFQVAGLFKLLN
jgi:hypothetical protein